MNRKLFHTLTLTCMLAISCTKSKDDSAHSNQIQQQGANTRLTTEQLNYINTAGKQHTKGLQFAYNYLVALKASSPEIFDSAKTLSPACRNGLHQFYTTNEIGWIQANSNSFISESDNAYDQFYTQSFSDPYYYHTHDLWRPEQDAALSTPVKSLLTSLRIIALDSTKTLEQSLSEISALEGAANASLENTTDLALVLSVTSVAKSSLTYWNDNIGSWSALLGDIVHKSTASMSVGRAAGIGDIAGAVAGVTRSAVLALFGPVGVVAFISGAIAGGIAGSVAGAITVIITNH